MQRRQFLTAAALSATGGGFACLAAGPVRALSLEPAPAQIAGHLRMSAPTMDGALDWDLLAQAGETRFQDGTLSRFPAALRGFDGKDVRITGYMMPFRDGDQHREFLLGALQFHCPTCMTGDLARLVAVRADKPVTFAQRPLLMRGTLRLLEDEASPLYYRLDAAQAV
jgi:hypothetical protein